MSTSLPTCIPFPYLVDDLFHFTLYGRWRSGGYVRITYNGVPVALIRLPRAKWAVMAILALWAQRTEAHGSVAAFLTSDELREQLRERTPLRFTAPQGITRFVFDLRKLLTKSDAAALDGCEEPGPEEWGHRLVEFKKALGYRISVRPKNLEVHVLDEPS